MVLDSSTVMTPSRPTFSIALAISSPMVRSLLALMEATCAISSLSLIILACFLISMTASVTALSIPRRIPIGLTPAATLFIPSLIMDQARTVAVVVPSPATSFVLVATSLRSWAPMFSNGSSSSISRATETPSLVTLGAPNFLSITTKRPLGPRVAITARDIFSTPATKDLRASSLNCNCFAIIYILT